MQLENGAIAAHLINIILLAGAVAASIVCLVLLIRRIRQRRQR